MELSLPLARILGVILVILYSGILINQKLYRRYWESLPQQPLFIFLSGLLALIVGSILIQLHNIWVPDWRVAITFFGWLLFLSSVFRVLFPKQALQAALWVFRQDTCVFNLIFGSFALLGAYLAYIGFSA